MLRSYASPLTATQAALRILIVVNLLFGAFVLVLLATSLAAESWFFQAMGVRPTADPMLFHAMRLIMVVGIGSVPLAHVVLTKLLTIVRTVGASDPFVPENAGRLQSIAWALLGLELLHLVVGAIAAAVSSDEQPLDIGWSFGVTGWLAVLLLFVLARVFAHGAAMREELEGTV